MQVINKLMKLVNLIETKFWRAKADHWDAIKPSNKVKIYLINF